MDKDFLLGVYDKARMGGLRFKVEKDGTFQSDDQEWATPPWTSLRKLEQATAAFENDDSGLEEKWLRQLIAPSLGAGLPILQYLFSYSTPVSKFIYTNGIEPQFHDVNSVVTDLNWTVITFYE